MAHGWRRHGARGDGAHGGTEHDGASTPRASVAAPRYGATRQRPVTAPQLRKEREGGEMLLAALPLERWLTTSRC